MQAAVLHPLYGARIDPLRHQQQARLSLQKRMGLGYCNITKCCTEVCPEHIKITDNGIIPLKERGRRHQVRPDAGSGGRSSAARPRHLHRLLVEPDPSASGRRWCSSFFHGAHGRSGITLGTSTQVSSPRGRTQYWGRGTPSPTQEPILLRRRAERRANPGQDCRLCDASVRGIGHFGSGGGS